jgi:hypothetical protein
MTDISSGADIPEFQMMWRPADAAREVSGNIKKFFGI